MATGPKPYASLDEMWKAFGDLSNNKTPAINGEKMFSLPLSSSGMRSSAPSGPVPPVMGAATADCRPRRLHGRWGRAIIQLSCLGMTTRPNAGPSKSIIMRRFLPFALRLKPATLLSGAPFSRPPHAAALRENRGHCLNCHEDTHSFRNCRHPFINASGCLNPELGQLGDDNAYRRWQARMTTYRRDGTSSRCLLYTSPSPRDRQKSRMPSSA